MKKRSKKITVTPLYSVPPINEDTKNKKSTKKEKQKWSFKRNLQLSEEVLL